MGINGLIRYQFFEKWSKMEQKCKNQPYFMLKTLKTNKIGVSGLCFNPFIPICGKNAKKRVQGRSPWRVPRGEPGAE